MLFLGPLFLDEPRLGADPSDTGQAGGGSDEDREGIPGRFWLYPRHDARNSGATSLRADFLVAPMRIWTFTMDVTDGGAYPVAADLEGDGSVEVLAGDAAGNLYCLDAASGGLRWRRTLPSFFKWGSPVLHDLDRDGVLDVVVGAGDLFALDGASGLTRWRSLVGVDVLGMSADDLDGDGDLEIFCTDYLSPRHGYLVRGQDGQVLWTVETTGSNYNLPAFLDVDGDGVKEILFTRHGDGRREKVLCLRAGDGATVWSYQCAPDPLQELMAPPELGYMVDFGYQSVTVADFDGDGAPEVSSGTDLNHYLFERGGGLVWKVHQGILGNGWTRIRESDGTTTYHDHHYQIYDQAVADLDGDGLPDMVYGLISDYITDFDETTQKGRRRFIRFRNQVRAIRGASGSTLWTFTGPSSGAGIGRTWDPVLADVDGDTRPEVLVASEDGYLYALQGEDGSVLWQLAAGPFGMSRGRIVVDVDGDGKGELIVTAGARVMMYDASTLAGDIDGSGRVDGGDLLLLGWAFGSVRDGKRYLPAADLDASGTVDGTDLAILAFNFGES